MNSSLSLCMAPEVVARAVDSLVLAAERQSLDVIKSTAETITAAIVHAYHIPHQGGKQEKQRQEQRMNNLNIAERLQILHSLTPIPLSHVLNVLQRIHAFPTFGMFERGISTTLVNLLFCTITLFRSVGHDLMLLQDQQQKSVYSDVGLRVREREEWEQLLMFSQRYSELKQELGGVFRDCFSLMAYNAEQQLWQLEAAAIPIKSIDLPVLHVVPSSTASLSSHDCWIWLVVEVTTCAVFITNTVFFKEVNEVSWVTQVLLAMGPEDPLNTPFAQKLTDIVLDVYVFLLKQWMTRFPGLAESLNTWSQQDTIASLSSMISLQVVDKKYTSSCGSSANDGETHNNVNYKDEITIPAEVCIILYDIVHHLPAVFRSASPMLKLLRVLSQLSVGRLFFVIHQYFGESIAANKLSVGLSLLLNTVSEFLFVCSDHATCRLLPSEASVPYIRLTLFNIAAYSFELQTGMDSALLSQIHMPSATASLRYASMLQCIGTVSEGFEGHPPSQKNNNEGALVFYTDALFAQAFVLGIEDVYSTARTLASSVNCTASMQRFFDDLKQILHDTVEERNMKLSSFSSKGEGCEYNSFLSKESLAAVEHILSLYVEVLPSEEGGVMPKHRCWWLLAVSYLRIAGIEAQLRQLRGVPLTSVEHYDDVITCCGPSESVRWLYLEEQEGTTCSTYDEWMQLHRRINGNMRIKPSRIASTASTLRERLISASLQFLLTALRATITLEAVEAKEKRWNEVDDCYRSHYKKMTSMNSEISQSTAYITAFTRFLLTMEHVQPTTVVHCSEACARVISEAKSTFWGEGEGTDYEITEADNPFFALIPLMSQPTLSEVQYMTINPTNITTCEVDGSDHVTCEPAELHNDVYTTEVPQGEHCTDTPSPPEKGNEMSPSDTEISSTEAWDADGAEKKELTPHKDEDESEDTAAATKRRRLEDTARDSAGCEERDAAAMGTLSNADEELPKIVSAVNTQEGNDTTENSSQWA